MPLSPRSVAGALLTLFACTSCAAPEVRTDAEVAPVVSAGAALADEASDRAVDSRLAPRYDDERVREMIDAFRAQAATPLVAGNRVTLLVDGPQTLGAIRQAIEAARDHVHVETYIFADDEVGRAFRDLLMRRHREGVEVRVLYDAIGSVTTPAAFFDEMRQAGVEVLQFRPLDPVRTPLPWKINNRDHRKIVVVDGKTAFTGGINISSTYASSSRAKPGPKQGQDEAWRDTHVQIDGPVAAQFQALYFATWTRAGGNVDTKGARYFPPLAPAGSELVAAVATDADAPDEVSIYGTYYATVRHASRRLWMTQAYFAPNKTLRRELIAAAQRGVDVRIIVPGFTDSGLIFHASRANYEELLEGGVRLFEQTDSLLHAKTVVADTALSMVGSANFDMRSFLHNNEVSAVVIGSDFGKHMEQLFERDMVDAREVTLESWRKRPLADKLKEAGSRLFSYWL